MPEATFDTQEDSRRAYVIGVLFLLGAAILWSLNGVLIKAIYAGGSGPHGVVIAFYRSLLAGLFLLPLARGRWRSLLSAQLGRTFHSPTAREHAPTQGGTEVTYSDAVPVSVGSPHGLIVQDSSAKAPGGGESAQAAPIPPAASGVPHSLRIRPAAVLCVVFFTLMTVSFVVANTMTEASNAIILQYTSTFWIFCLSPLVVGETPHRRDVWILLLAISGIAIIFAGNWEASLFGCINGLLAGLFYGLLTLMLRRLRDCHPAAITVANNLGSTLLILPLALWIGGLWVAPTTWLLLLLLGVVQFGIPYYLYSLGLARVPAYQAGLITLIEPVLVPAWTYWALGEAVPRWTMVGGVVVLAALVLYVASARRHYLRVTEALTREGRAGQAKPPSDGE